MRVLTFDPDDRRFERLYAWTVQGRPLADRGQAKTHGALLDKLEAIGQIKPAVNEQTGDVREYKLDEVRFYVTVSGGTVTLEEAEYELAKQRVAALVDAIHPSLSREFERLLAWLDALPKQDAAIAKSEAAA